MWDVNWYGLRVHNKRGHMQRVHVYIHGPVIIDSRVAANWYTTISQYALSLNTVLKMPPIYPAAAIVLSMPPII